MNQTDLPRSKAGAHRRTSNRRRLMWAFVTALTATAALGVVVPRLAGHGNAHASVTSLQTAASPKPVGARAAKPAPSSATWDSTVPAASDVFVNPESGAVVSATPPTF